MDGVEEVPSFILLNGYIIEYQSQVTPASGVKKTILPVPYPLNCLGPLARLLIHRCQKLQRAVVSLWLSSSCLRCVFVSWESYSNSSFLEGCLLGEKLSRKAYNLNPSLI